MDKSTDEPTGTAAAAPETLYTHTDTQMSFEGLAGSITLT